MKQNCQVKFDDNNRKLTVTLTTNDVKQNFTLSYVEIRRGLVKHLASSRAHKLSYKELKSVSNEIANHFRIDPKSPLSWSEQFCLVLGHAAGVIHPKGRMLSNEERNLLKIDVINSNLALCDKASVTKAEFAEAISAGYCGGVDSMFCTDDYLTIRKGNTIIARIGLPGNDYNELKAFHDSYIERVLVQENADKLAEAVRQMKMDKAMELASQKGVLQMHGGLKLGEV